MSCNEGNTQDAKFCSKRKMIMSFEGYQEALESQKEKEDKLSIMEERFNLMHTQMQWLISILSSMDHKKYICKTTL